MKNGTAIILSVVLLLIGILLGAGVGWLVRGRAADRDLAELADRSAADLAAARNAQHAAVQRADSLSLTLRRAADEAREVAERARGAEERAIRAEATVRELVRKAADLGAGIEIAAGAAEESGSLLRRLREILLRLQAAGRGENQES